MKGNITRLDNKVYKNNLSRCCLEGKKGKDSEITNIFKVCGDAPTTLEGRRGEGRGKERKGWRRREEAETLRKDTISLSSPFSTFLLLPSSLVPLLYVFSVPSFLLPLFLVFPVYFSLSLFSYFTLSVLRYILSPYIALHSFSSLFALIFYFKKFPRPSFLAFLFFFLFLCLYSLFSCSCLCFH